MFADHFGCLTKLFGALQAESATSTGCQVMHADPISRCPFRYLFPHPLEDTAALRPKRKRQGTDRGPAGAIVRAGMKNSRRAYPDHDLTRRRRWGVDLAQLEGLTGANQANGLHAKGGWTD